MKVSAREKGMFILLIVVAIAVFMWPEGDEFAIQNKTKISKTVLKILVTKYRWIKPFRLIKYKTKHNETLILKRNIFQFGKFIPTYNTDLAKGKADSQQLSNSNGKSLSKDVKKDNSPSPPEIDFNVIGIIRVENGAKAIVVTKGVELFVFREKETMFNDFILKEIGDKYVVIGYKNFDEERKINLENKGGF